jgi:hypothetical protein
MYNYIIAKLCFNLPSWKGSIHREPFHLIIFTYSAPRHHSTSHYTPSAFSSSPRPDGSSIPIASNISLLYIYRETHKRTIQFRHPGNLPNSYHPITFQFIYQISSSLNKISKTSSRNSSGVTSTKSVRFMYNL